MTGSPPTTGSPGLRPLAVANQNRTSICQRTTIITVWEHYRREELPIKALSAQDSYIMYAKNLDNSALGQGAIAASQDCRGRTLATGYRRRQRDQSQNLVRHVGSVLARGSLEILQPQPDFVRSTSWKQ